MKSGDNQTKAEIYVVLNPIAGSSSADEIQAALERKFDMQDLRYEIYITTGKENVAELVKKACQEGAELIVAAGGDGTVVGVVNGLIGTNKVLGVVPVGTGNGLARTLGIPLDPQEAIELLSERQNAIPIDAMQVGDRYYVLNVSAGISSRAMQKTPSDSKRRFGMLAYAWVIVGEVLGFRPQYFDLVVDNHSVQVRASEVLVSNGRPLKEAPFPLGPRERFNDGILDIYIVTARSLMDYLITIWNWIARPGNRKGDLHTLTARQVVQIQGMRRQYPVQADGEVIGETPVEVHLAHNAIRVIVPPEDSK